MKRKILLLLLATSSISGCTLVETQTVYKARTALVGGNIVDLMSCAGIPSKPPMQVEQDQVLVEWDETVSGTGTLSVTLPVGATIKLGTPSGSCHLDALVLRDGTVANVGFNGPALADAAAVCSGLVSECLFHPNQTELPKGFDAITMLMNAHISTTTKTGGGSPADQVDVTDTVTMKPAPAPAPPPAAPKKPAPVPKKGA